MGRWSGVLPGGVRRGGRPAASDSLPSVMAVQAARSVPNLPPPGDAPSPQAAAGLGPLPIAADAGPIDAGTEAGGLVTEAAPADSDWTIYPRLSLIHETGPGV